MGDQLPRDAATRRADTLALLRSWRLDAWVATSSASGVAHLVPLSLAWIDDRAVLAIGASSLTARNLAATGRARIGAGPTRDVVMLDVVVERIVAVGDDPVLGATFAAQCDWDPRASDDNVLVVLEPSRVQAWREAGEIEGRVLMRDGRWLA